MHRTATTTVLTALAAIALLTSGCEATDDAIAGNPTHDTTQPAEKPAERPVLPADDDSTADLIFLTTLDTVDSSIRITYGDDGLIGVAHSSCDALDAGATLMDMTNAVINAEFDVIQAGTILGAGVAAYCPEHSDVFDQ